MVDLNQLNCNRISGGPYKYRCILDGQNQLVNRLLYQVNIAVASDASIIRNLDSVLDLLLNMEQFIGQVYLLCGGMGTVRIGFLHVEKKPPMCVYQLIGPVAALVPWLLQCNKHSLPAKPRGVRKV